MPAWYGNFYAASNRDLVWLLPVADPFCHDCFLTDASVCVADGNLSDELVSYEGNCSVYIFHSQEKSFRNKMAMYGDLPSKYRLDLEQASRFMIEIIQGYGGMYDEKTDSWA